ncbi:hemagglutinin repeat-containing protein [Cupriavidus sp.]|uniref:hemagglutinin repeat-containing protein n=1 Tax=Cupriavidus sp. TaxID=1873897 RepID=UPI0025BEA038|nr:hemagglutinin repeat-containing protein [Cupriavidus sp.]MCA3188853.1 hemagglutinin repeat-containing protein [Cupriavidus sp.]MCA3198573.1 hemagglutinin repeat-containing protein [Cupriavidus sp.]MCA3201319.1 hemagglutinin repeat-containing protein [Cupriavidus sp.]MCA3209799.1 hemagglutinin repeat-containing protein [Cupriavidus sp.]
MNRYLYRLVFNAARGMLVAVHESAAGRGKNGGTRGSGNGSVAVDMATLPTTPIMVLTAALTAVLAGPPAQAQTLPIHVDRDVPGARPFVGTAANGTPVVNIAPPNRPGGTSINRFTDYNVGPSGVVVNNAGHASQTRIAGWVQGNPQLGNQHAGTIVQQVTAHNPSQLLGMQEIAGNRASLVVVNPAGITCAGCGTINADRFTLSTGRGMYDADGRLAGFDVQQGRIAIEGQGLSSPHAQVDLLARSMAINAGLWTGHLNAVAGANRVDYASLEATALPGSGAAPAYAIDASAVGAMYGGAVRLVGTEKGVGFHLGGTIAASTGDIVVESNGDVRIVDGARLQAQGNAAVAGAAIHNAGTVATQGSIQAVASGSLSNTGTLAAGGDLLARAERIANHGTLGSGVDDAAQLTQPGRMNLAATDRITSGGRILAGTDASLSGGTLDLKGGSLIAQGDATLATAGTLDNTAGLIHAGNRLNVEADRVVNRDTVGGADTNPLGMQGAWMQIVADAVDNTGGALRADTGLAVVSVTLDNSGGKVTADGMVEIEADATTNAGGLIASNSVVAITGSDLVGTGTVTSQRDVRIELSDTFENTGMVSAGDDLTLRVAGDVVNHGTLAAGGDLDIEGDQAIHNAGLIDGGAVRMEAQTTVRNIGRIYGDSVAIGAGERIVNDAHPETGGAGVIASRSGDIDLGAPEIANREHALIHASRDLRVGAELDGDGMASGQADRLINASATIDVARDAYLGAAEVDNLNSHFSTTRVDRGSESALTYRLDGSTDDIPADSVVLYHTRNGSWAPGTEPDFLGGDDYVMLVLPSTEYPFETFGPPFDWSRNAEGQPGIGDTARPVGLAFLPQIFQGGSTASRPQEAFIYPHDDVIWTKLGVERPEAPPLRASCGDAAPPLCQAQHESHAAAYEAWFTANMPRYLALNERIQAFNRDFNARTVKAFHIQRTTTHRQDEVVAATDPARILVGGNARIDGQVTNDKSQILAGGSLAVSAPVLNLDHDATRIDTVTGSRQWTYVKRKGRLKGSERVYDTYPVGPVAISVPVKLAAARTESGLGQITHGAGAPALRELPGTGDATIRQVTPALGMPDSALFQLNPQPGARYLIETDPRFTDRRQWLSSDEMLTRLGHDPEHVLKRLGDGFYEARLVADAVMLATGQRFVGDYTDNATQYAALMAAGVAFADRFQLGIGTELTPAQMAQLTSDVVWLVEKTVALPDGSTQQVLVPQVYLMTRVGDIQADGALIAADRLAIQTGGDVVNTGTISGGTVAQMEAGSIRNDGGTLHGATLALRADQDIDNVAGTLRGGTVTARAGRDIRLTTTTATGTAATGSITQVAGTASVDAENATFVAGRDISATAARIETRGDLEMRAARDLDLGTVTVAQHERGEIDARNRYERARTAEVGSEIRSGGSMTMLAGRDVEATAAQVSADGVLAVSAGRDIDIRAGEASASVRDEHHTKSSGFLSKKSTHTIEASARTEALGSTFSGDTVAMQAGRDLQVAGSTVAGTGDVSLAATRDVHITTARTTSSASSYREEKKSGFGATGGGISYGSRQQKDTSRDSAVTHAGSLVGSTEGSVSLRAGSTLSVTGSNVVAMQDITGTGADVRMDAAQNRGSHGETHEVRQTGLTLGVSGGAIGSALAAGQKIGSATRSQDGRASALWGMAAGRDAYDAVAGAAGAMDALSKGGAPAAPALTLSFGTSKSRSTFTQDKTSHAGSRVQAGGAARLIAAGVDADGQRAAGNLDVVGSDISAAKVGLAASRDVNIVSATDTYESHSTNKSSSGSLGVSFGAQGWGVSASGSSSKGKGDTIGTTQVVSRVRGGEAVSIVSGNDTSVLGGVVSGDWVLVDVGGNLNLASRQDTEESHVRQQSVGGGVSFSQGGGLSGSMSASKGRGDSSFANVAEQTGVFAGQGGFDIQVKGNTDLKGAVIASTAPGDQNRLTTGTLTWSDIENRSDYSGTSFGASGGITFGPKVEDKKSGSTSGKNTGGASPMIPQHESGHQRGVARAGIAEGAITITDAGSQTQDVATLNRDTTNANSGVGKGPDLNNVLTKQADMMAAAQAAGEAVAKTVGDIADSRKKATTDALRAANAAYAREPSEANQAAIDAAQADIDNWKEGGEYRAALHAAGGALVAGLGGGNAIAGAAGAGASSLAAQRLATLGDSVAKSLDSGSGDLDTAVGNLAANLMAGGLGTAIGGGAGAATAANADRFNRQLHPDERQWAKDKARAFAAEYEDKTGKPITVDQAERMLLASGYRIVDAVASKGPGGDATATAFISRNGGGLFSATTTEYNNPFLNGLANGALTPEQRALPAAVANPVAGLAIAGGIVAATPGTAAAAVAAVRACIASPILCMNRGGVFAGEIAAGEAMPAGTGAAITVGVAAAGKAADDVATSRVFRVQGGTMPDASWHRITIDGAGNPHITNDTLNISIGDPSHAEYFLRERRPGGEIVSFEIPVWMDDFIQENAIDQYRYTKNPRNQGKMAPKIVDSTTPGRSYELHPIWGTWLEEVAIPGSGRVTK